MTLDIVSNSNIRSTHILVQLLHGFLAPLAEGQRAIVMALCPSCVRPFVRPSMRACVRKLFLRKTSPQKLLTRSLRNFTGMFLRWSSFRFLQIIVFYEEFWLPCQSQSKKPLKILSSQTTNWIALLFCRNVYRGLQNSFK